MALLDWRDSKHWSNAEAPCGCCGKLTHLRSDLGKPVHKVCAEQWIDQHRTPSTVPDQH